jgi:hypothetical protein
MNKAQALNLVLTGENKAESLISEAEEITKPYLGNNEVFVSDQEADEVLQRTAEIQVKLANLLLLRAEAEMTLDFPNANPILN